MDKTGLAFDPALNAVDQETAGRIRAFLEESYERQLYFLRWLALAESPSSSPEAQEKALNVLAEALERVGFKAIRIPGRGGSGGALYARPARRVRGRPAQLLLGHCDTVWPLGTLETMPLETDGGILRGPGVYDMKAGLTQMVYALKAIHELGLEPPLTPLVFVNSDEEIGSRESTRYVRMLARRTERAFVLEPSLGTEGKLKTTRKGGASFRVRIEGKAAHAGLNPEQGASAILELSYVLQKLFALNDWERGVSVNVGQIDGGVRANVVAPESEAIVDVRAPRLADLERVERAIQTLSPETEGVRLEIHKRGMRPPLEPTRRNRILWLAARQQASLLGLDLEEGMAGGGSDGSTASQYTAVLDGLGAVGDGAHAANEHIRLDKLTERTALLTLLLMTPSLAHLTPDGF